MRPIEDLKYWNSLRQLMADLQFPFTEESLSYGTPAFKVKKILLCRLWEDGRTLVVHSDDRDEWIDADTDGVFFVTDHYAKYPYVLVHLHLIGKKKLRSLMIQSWKEIAPPKLVTEWENRG